MRASVLAGLVKRGLASRMTEEHLTLMEVDAERAIRDGFKSTATGDELLALVGEVRESRGKVCALIEFSNAMLEFAKLTCPEFHAEMVEVFEKAGALKDKA